MLQVGSKNRKSIRRLIRISTFPLCLLGTATGTWVLAVSIWIFIQPVLTSSQSSNLLLPLGLSIAGVVSIVLSIRLNFLFLRLKGAKKQRFQNATFT